MTTANGSAHNGQVPPTIPRPVPGVPVFGQPPVPPAALPARARRRPRLPSFRLPRLRLPSPRQIGVGLAVLGGARADALAAIPGAANRYIGMAATLTFTSVVAGLSAATALTIALHARLWVAIVLGIFWGLLIFNLDRLLLVTLSKDDSNRVKILGVLMRVALAACLAVAISTPVTLIIFEKEINQELAVTQAAQDSAYQAQLATYTQGKTLAGYENQLTANENTLNSGTIIDKAGAAKVSEDLILQNAAYQNYLQQVARVEGEVEGTSGTHRPGCGPVCAVESAGVQQALDQYNAAVKQTKQDEAAETTYQNQETQRLKAQDTTLTGEISAIKQAQAAQVAAYAKTTASSDGLLARIEALWRLGGSQPAARISHLFVFMVFFIIELLPILMKSFQLWGSKTKYEEAVTSIDETSLRIHNTRMDVVSETALAQKMAQLEAARILNEQIIEAQKQVFRAHLDDWVRKAVPGSGNNPNSP